MSAEVFRAYLVAYLKGGADVEFGSVRLAFTEPILDLLRQRISASALDVPLLLTDDLPDRIFGCTLTFRDGSILIALNARMKVDPEFLAHTLIEELMHVQQILDGVDFDAERSLPYAVRSYELEAKRLATEVLGYEPLTDEALRRRPEPADPLNLSGGGAPIETENS